MPKTIYNISLKGYVGRFDFDRSKVDKELAKSEGKEINLVIGSLGGSLAIGWSISSIFKNHGKLNVYFVGLSASTANFASYSTAHITIDTVDLYLDNKYSMGARFVVTSLCQPIIK